MRSFLVAMAIAQQRVGNVESCGVIVNVVRYRMQGRRM